MEGVNGHVATHAYSAAFSLMGLRVKDSEREWQTEKLQPFWDAHQFLVYLA